MKLNEVAEQLGLHIYCCGDMLGQHEVKGGYVSDLLSDVMGNAKEGQVLITLQTHKNVMAVASLKDLSAVVLVKGLVPDADTLQHAEEEKIPMLGTNLETFEIAGRLYNILYSETGKG